MKTLFLALCLVASLVQATAWAHGGRTDKKGCHLEKKTGIRHCH